MAIVSAADFGLSSACPTVWASICQTQSRRHRRPGSFDVPRSRGCRTNSTHWRFRIAGYFRSPNHSAYWYRSRTKRMDYRNRISTFFLWTNRRVRNRNRSEESSYSKASRSLSSCSPCPSRCCSDSNCLPNRMECHLFLRGLERLVRAIKLVQQVFEVIEIWRPVSKSR